jgi:hydrogenase maturation protease
VHLVLDALPRHAHRAHVSASPPLITVIGIGNPYRGDDGVGPAVVAGLRDRFGNDPRVRLVELDGEPALLVQAWAEGDVVIVVDAVRSSHPSGTIHTFRAGDLDGLAAEDVSFGSGHLLGLRDAVHLADALDRLPARLEIIGVEGAQFALGEGLSDPVGRACARVVAALSARLDGQSALQWNDGLRRRALFQASMPSIAGAAANATSHPASDGLA